MLPILKSRPGVAWRVDTKLKDVAPEDWRARVLTITDKPLRFYAASIIWWDYFGVRTSVNAWPHLDDIIAPPNITAILNCWPKDEDLEAALLSCGYGLEAAKRRAKGPKTYYTKSTLGSGSGAKSNYAKITKRAKTTK